MALTLATRTSMRRGRTTHAAGPASTGTAPIPALKTSSHFGTLNRKTAPCDLKKLSFAALAKFALRNPRGMTKGLSSSPSIAAAISNRHLVQLKFTATPTNSTISLFLIDPNRPHFPRTARAHSAATRAPLECGSRAAVLPFSRHSTHATQPRPTPTPSNRHLVQLEFATTPAQSNTSLFLIDTKHPQFPGTHPHSPETLVAQARPACVRFPSSSADTHPISTVYSMQLKFATTPTPSRKLHTLLSTHSHVRPSAVRLHRPAVAFPAPLSNTFPEASGGLL
jgi:hypothetical protein